MKNLVQRFCVVLGVLILLSFPVCSQTTISVIGKGMTQEDAVQDALRSAVEKATGVFVYSATDVENFKVIKDKIASVSKGYVIDYKITDTKNYEGLIVITADVAVDLESIKSTVQKDIKAVTYQDLLKDYNLITQKMERLQKSAEILQAISSRPVEEMYDAQFEGYEIMSTGLNEMIVNLSVRLSPNIFFWDGYEDILNAISERDNGYFVCGKWHTEEITEKVEDNPGSYYSKYVDKLQKKLVAQYYTLNRDLEPYVLQPRAATIDISIPSDTDVGCVIEEKGLLFNIVYTYNGRYNVCNPVGDYVPGRKIALYPPYRKGGFTYDPNTVDQLSESEGYQFNQQLDGITYIPPQGKILKCSVHITKPDLLKQFNKIIVKIIGQNQGNSGEDY